ncbi:MAG: substrate-binding domain-containing protein [Acidothermus sp.]|nr:substrate-binding domain-containing protein [Acidothermus sp.]MCL6538301.1 substrate-binding domain-containing protein [Acidothermus sp.]
MTPLTRRPVWRGLAALAVLPLVITACSSGGGTPKKEATNSPAAGAGGSAVPTGAQFCKGMKIVFFPGGTPGGPFETVVYNGAKAAAAALGPSVTYQWSDWDPDKMITQFKQAMATHPDGIAIMGHPGDAAFDPLIDQAEAEGITVTVMNTELPKAEATYQSKGMGYVGAVLYQAGASLANEAIKRGNLHAGDRVFVWGLLSQPGRGERTKGIVDTLKKAGMTVDYLEINDATNKDPSAGVSIFTGYVSKHPDVKAIFIDHGNLTATIPTYMKAANLKPGSVFAAGFDMSPATVKGIQDGYISLVIDQQEWLQGYFGILQLCLSHIYGFSGLRIDTGAGFDDKSNIDKLAPLVEKQIR